MPPRQFDGQYVRAVRRSLELSQTELAERAGVSAAAVGRWETGSDFPRGEKLPAIAEALQKPLNELFPHDGAADLQLLRCDAGLTVAEAAAKIGTSKVPVNYAEGGRRRLSDAYVGTLARAYGVTEEELLAAQDVTFGVRLKGTDGEQESAFRTVGEKINHVLEHGYVGRKAPSDEEIARGVNKHARRVVVTADDIAALRTGATTEAEDDVRAGLADALETDAGLFRDDAELNPVAREFLESIRFLNSVERKEIIGLAARGNDAGLSAEMMAQVNKLVGKLREKLPEVPGKE